MKVDYFTIPEITVSFKDNVKPSERAVVRTSDAAAKIFAVAFDECMEHHEEIHVLYLNRAMRVLGISCITKGGLNSSYADIRIILQIGLKACAQYLMVSHNHPSGNLYPSQEDINLTNMIKSGCSIVGLTLLDHVIMTNNNYLSMVEEGLI